MKCDETKPFCRRCTETGRNCDGPQQEDTKFVNVTYAQTELGAPPFLNYRRVSIFPNYSDGRESHSFDFFINHVSPLLSRGLDANFWLELVPRLSYSSKIVWHAILAISQLYERNMGESKESLHIHYPPIHNPDYQQALKWYNRSLSTLRDLDSQDSATRSISLVCCLLFVSIEFQQRNVKNAATLLRSGYKLVIDQLNEPQTTNEELDNTGHALFPLFIRQLAQVAQHGHDMDRSSWDKTEKYLLIQKSTEISCIRDARNSIYVLGLRLSWFTRARYEAGNDHSRLTRLEHERMKIQIDLDMWHENFTNYLQTIDTSSTLELQHSSATVWTYYGVCKIWCSPWRDTQQTTYDLHFDTFDMIVTQAGIALDALSQLYQTLPVYSFEMGMIPPLYFTAWKCRHPRIRHQALRLMKQAPLQEGLFLANQTWKAAEKIIEIEESGSKVTLSLNGEEILLPTEEARMYHATIRWESETGAKLHPTLDYWRDEKFLIKGSIPLR